MTAIASAYSFTAGRLMVTRHLGFALNLIALCLFIPGILLPMFSMNMEMAALLGNSSLTSTLVDKELSIMATIMDLWQNQRFLVATLILIFSVCIPVCKTTLVSLAYFKRGSVLERRITSFVASIGKWSMADVFVVAVFLAILSTDHGQTLDVRELSFFGFKMDLEISSQTLSAAGDGFYFFSAYCLLSLLGTHLALRAINPQSGASSHIQK